MKKLIFIIPLILLTATISWAQFTVVDAAVLEKNLPVNYMPDVEGKVVVGDLNFSGFSWEKSREGIEIYAGFPVEVSGANERGGIYANLDEDPDLELIYPSGATLHALNPDGTEANGWPQALDYPADGAAAFGDIDGDGVGEVVVTTHQTGSFAFGTIYAFEIDGSDADGFPVTTEGGAVRTPVLADIDEDGAYEIIITVRNWPEGFVYVFRGDGTIYPNWPVRMDYVPACGVAVGDINGDEIPEIVTESYYGLHVYNLDGTVLDGFPYLPGLARVFSYSTPVLSDLNGDGNREIICGDHSTENGSGAVHVVNHLGQPLDGWPKITGSWIYGPPSVGDINGDGLLDIVVGDQALSATPVNKVYAWTGITADTLDGYPINDLYGINSQIILADIDGDGEVEMVFDDNTSIGKFQGYNHDGTIMEGWPLPVNGSTFFVSPMAVDVNLDGTLDLSGAGYDNGSGLLSIYLWNANVAMDNSLAILPVLQYNSRHSGVYGDTLMVGITEQGGVGAGGHGNGEAGKRGSIQIVPNPVKDVATILVDNIFPDREIHISILSASGIKIISQKIISQENEIQLDIHELQPGIYILRLTDRSGDIGYGKIIKQ